MRDLKNIPTKKAIYFVALQFFLFSQLTFALGTAVKYKKKKLKNKLYSLSIKGGLINMADISRDGKQSYFLYMPSVHPLMQNVIKLSSNYYTESLEFSSYLNSHRQIKAVMPKMLHIK
ncbi:MAG: hypothetical protein COB02_14750 [Candidatus Cloacimonadota bacterium]|nr:MAG: hypothetical protein COB02_14750 [Candidatus Cloacimonadota bacterium]